MPAPASVAAATMPKPSLSMRSTMTPETASAEKMAENAVVLKTWARYYRSAETLIISWTVIIARTVIAIIAWAVQIAVKSAVPHWLLIAIVTGATG